MSRVKQQKYPNPAINLLVLQYQGECDLVLIEVPDFKDGNALNIHVRTTIRYVLTWGQPTWVYFTEPANVLLVLFA